MARQAYSKDTHIVDLMLIDQDSLIQQDLGVATVWYVLDIPSGSPSTHCTRARLFKGHQLTL